VLRADEGLHGEVLMRTSQKVCLIAMLGLAIYALVLFFLAVAAQAGQPSFEERLVDAQKLLQSKSDEPVDPAELAAAIAALPRVNRDWAALVLTIGGHESALSARIARGECKPLECDHGAAWGLFQQHKNTFNADVWGSPDIGVQTREVARALRSAFYTCNGRGALRPDWIARTINGYAGHSCDAVWPGLEQRLATYKRVRARLG
jgi:hypothetical protein